MIVCGMYMYLYVCAVVASSTAVSDPAGARRLGNASIGVSIAGIVVIIVIIIISVVVAGSSSSCNYTYNGKCYRHRDYYYSYCSGVESYSGYCYYN